MRLNNIKISSRVFSKVILGLILCVILFAPISSLAQGGTTTLPTSEESQRDIDNTINNLQCWIPGTFTGSLNLEGCLALLTYYIFKFTAFILAIAGKLFDFLLFFTIKSETYSGGYAQFIEKGWQILRDIANITFIFILLYLAIRIILNLKAAEAKKFIFMDVGKQ